MRERRKRRRQNVHGHTEACWETAACWPGSGAQRLNNNVTTDHPRVANVCGMAPPVGRGGAKGLTREDEFLLHHVEVSAGPPDSGAQHDLLRVVAAHAAHPVPAGATRRVRDLLEAALKPELLPQPEPSVYLK